MTNKESLYKYFTPEVAAGELQLLSFEHRIAAHNDHRRIDELSVNSGLTGNPDHGASSITTDIG